MPIWLATLAGFVWGLITRWWLLIVTIIILIAIIVSCGPQLVSALNKQPSSTGTNNGTTPVLPAPVNPARPAPASNVSLKYDETGGTQLITGQTKLLALYVRDAMAANGSQAAMESAISAIQREAQSANATVKEDNSLTLPRDSAWFVWCSNASNVSVPTDVTDTMGKLRTGPGKIWIVVPFAQGVPWPSVNTFAGCIGKFWTVAVH